MAVSYTAERKAGTATTSGANVFTFSPATNCTNGSTLVLVVGGGSVTSVTDSVGANTWTIDLTSTSTSLCHFAICASYQTTGLTTSDTITVTTDVASTVVAYWFEEFSGNYSAKDVSSSSTGSNSTNMPTGTASNTTTDAFLICSSNANAAGAITKNASLTNVTTGDQTHGVAVSHCSYQLLTTTASRNGAATDANMVTSANGFVVYKASGVVNTKTLIPTAAATAVTFSKQTNKPLSASVVTLATLLRSIVRSFALTVLAVPAVGKQVGKVLHPYKEGYGGEPYGTDPYGDLGSVVVYVTLSTLKVKVVTLTTNAVVAVATLTKQTNKVLGPAVVCVVTLAKLGARAYSASVATSASVLKQVGKVLSATCGTAASLVRSGGKAFSALVVIVPTMFKVVGKVRSATVTPIAVTAKSAGKACAASASAVPGVVKDVGKTLSTSVVALVTLIAQFISGGGVVHLLTLSASVTVNATLSTLERVALHLTPIVCDVLTMTAKVCDTLTLTSMADSLLTLAAKLDTTVAATPVSDSSLTATPVDDN